MEARRLNKASAALICVSLLTTFSIGGAPVSPLPASSEHTRGVASALSLDDKTPEPINHSPEAQSLLPGFATNSDGTSTRGNTWGFTAAVGARTWDGSVSSDWHTAENWTPSGVPTASDDVTIPNVDQDPVISTGDAQVNNLTVNEGTVLDLTDRMLMVEGTLTNDGTLKRTQAVAEGSTTDFLRITNLAGTQTRYYGVDITPSGIASSDGLPDPTTSPAIDIRSELQSHQEPNARRAQSDGWLHKQAAVPLETEQRHTEAQDQETFYAVADATVLEGAPTFNTGSTIDMWVGYEHCPDTPNGIARSLVRFDVSDIPAGASIQEATLGLYLTNSCDMGERTHEVTVYRTSSTWSESSVTWNTQPSLAELYDSASIPSQTWGWYFFDVSDLVRGWVSGSFSNRGLVLRGPESSGTDSARLGFWTREGDSPPELVVEYTSNTPPNAPSNPSPADGATGVSTDLDLSWTGGDPDPGDSVTYDVYFEANDITPEDLLCDGVSTPTCDPGALAYDTHYYWYVEATDDHDASTTGDTWDFTTSSEPNTPPYQPSNPSPADGATNQDLNVDLSWTGGDPDAGDTVTYDVFFEANDTTPDELLCDDVSTTSCDPGMLDADTPYYWYVEATDDHDASTTGDTWDFTTAAELNEPPSQPDNPTPADGATNQDLNVDLSWTGGDPDSGDTVTYDVYFQAGGSQGGVYCLQEDDIESAKAAKTDIVWRTRANMPTARTTQVVEAAHGKIYAIGGYDGSDYLARVEEYDPATDTWTTRASMPTARSGLGVAAANGRIYAIGGYNGSSRLATVEEYDPATNTWAARANMPTPRTVLGVAAASNGKIYAIGGSADSGRVATVEEYDPATDTWTTRASMPTARSALGLAAGSDGKIYAIGGSDEDPTAVVEAYDPATDTWSTRTNMPTARDALGVAPVTNGKMYAVGGTSWVPGGPVVHDTVEAYDPATDSWVTQTSLPSGREYPAVVGASSGRVYVVGGVVGRWSGSPNYRSTVFEGTLTPDELLCNDVSTPACDPGTLDAGMHYYWYVIATDNHGASTEGEVWHFTTAESANEPPTISDLPDRQVPMNGSADDAIDLWAYANDAEDADDELTFTISNSPAAGAGLTIDSNRYVDINPVTGWTGTTEVEIQVEDSGGLTDTDSFQVTITNSPPTISGLPDQELRMNSSVDNAIDLWTYASDAEDSVAGLTFTISNAPASGAGVSIDSNRYIDINPTTDWTGETEVEIEVEDTGGLTDSGTFRVRVRAYSVYLPLVMRRWPPIPDVPVLSAINNPDGDGNYTVNWGSVDLADTYTLQEDDSAAFSNPTTRYTGSGTSWDATGKAPGTYHYRVKASNAWGDSGWSNVESITVPVPELEPCPAGTIEYTGTTDQDRPVKICTDPAFSAVKQVTLNYRVACEGRTTEGTVKVTSEAGWPIENRSFSIEVTYRFDIAGTFNPGFNDVNGTWQGIIAECSGWPGPCWEVCRGPVGEWNGTRQP